MMRTSLFLAILAVALPAASCGPDFPEAVFVKRFGPDTPYSTFTGGRLGIPRPTYRVRHLAIAYNLLTSRPLNVAEQRAAEQANAALLNDGTMGSEPAAPGYKAWLKARETFGPLDGVPPPASITVTRSVPGSPYQDFPNCLNDAFATAARTLQSRAATHGATSPEVREWVRGQDRVFANCGDLPASFSGATYHPETPPPLSLPAVLHDAPLWLAQDRAYQMAAAHFYAAEYDAALGAFRAIAADPASPWSTVSSYLAARTLIRRATLSEAAAESGENKTPAEHDAASRQAMIREQAALREARSALQGLRTDPRMSSLQHSTDGLLDWLALRLNPEAQRLVLAARLHAANDSSFGQDLIDLTFATVHPLPGAKEAGPATKAAPAALEAVNAQTKPEAAMLAWLDVMSAGDPNAALANWRSTHTTAWLLAALSFAKASDPAASDLTRAADEVPTRDPAWVAVTYHRLRLMPRDAALRSALAAVLPTVESKEGRSAQNLYAALDGATAPDLDGWLRTAAQVPAGVSVDDLETDLSSADGPSASELVKPADQACGPALSAYQMKLFTPPAAETLNTRMPLALLTAAAESRALPPHLRFAVAQSAWARAVLLDRPQEARRLTPILAGCREDWRPVLKGYDNAASPQARHVAGLFALMRFASTEPNVRAGEPRSEGFATYSLLRDNWWDKTVSPALHVSEQNFTGAVAPVEEVPSAAEAANSDLVAGVPVFLTNVNRADAQTEIAALRKIPSASDYFPREALAWWRSHPRDPADADLLGQAMRVARNAPRTEHTAANEHALFDALHSAFPNSTWAKKYVTWE